MKLKSWDGHLINDGTKYVAHWGQFAPHGLPAVEAGFVPRSGHWPVLTSVQRPGRLLRFSIYVRTGGGGSSAELSGWFDPEDETARQLVVEDTAGGNSRYVFGICEQFEEVPFRAGLVYLAQVRIHNDVRWREVTPSTDTEAIPANGYTWEVTNNGKDNAFPIVRVKPTTLKASGFSYRKPVFIKWPALYGDSRYPLDLTNALFDTAAEIADTTRSVQINSGGGIDASQATIPYDTEVGTFPSSGLAYVDTEQIHYTGKSGTHLTAVTRGVNGTTAATHADNAVIRASRMQAEGDDLRVYANGVEIDRWLSGINTSTTKVWVTLPFQPAITGVLATAIAASGAIDTIDFAETLTAGAFAKLPNSGAVMIDSEVLTYQGKINQSRQLTGITRATRGTSEAAHTTTDEIFWLQHDLVIFFGDATLAAPTRDPMSEPIFNLATSTNASWDYDSFGTNGVPVGSEFATRPGAWIFNNITNSSRYYTANRDTNATPWSEIGVANHVVGGQFSAARWLIQNPCFITAANFQNGEKYSNTNLSAWTAFILSQTPAGLFVVEDTIAAPSVLNTWESWSDNETLTSGQTGVALQLERSPGVPKVDDQFLEVADVTLTLNSSYTPVSVIGARVTFYPLSCRISNNETGEAIDLNFSMALNQELEVDTDRRTVTYLADGSNQFQALTLVGGPRKDWLRLVPGVNELQFDEADLLAVTVDLEWEERHRE